MRKLLYDCYYGKTLVKTVATQKKAKEWKATNPKNFYKIRLEKITTLQNPTGSIGPAAKTNPKKFFKKGLTT